MKIEAQLPTVLATGSVSSAPTKPALEDEQRGKLPILASHGGRELWLALHQALQSQGHAHGEHQRHLGFVNLDAQLDYLPDIETGRKALSENDWIPAKRKVMRGMGGVPDDSSFAIPSIAREGGDLPPPPPTTGRNSLLSTGETGNQGLRLQYLLASRSSPHPRLSPCWGPNLRFSCRSPSMP